MNPNLLSDPSLAFDAQPPRRVVSLVPSITGSLFDLGLDAVLVGITDYCLPPIPGAPVGLGAGLPRLGGPKNPNEREIIALQPDLILANREENERESIERLAEAGIPVWVAFPNSVQAALNDLWTLANLFRSDRAMQQVDLLERAVELTGLAAMAEPVRYFCPIWEDALSSGECWWMTFNEQTYSSDLLRLFGGENVFAGRARRYPLAAEFGLAPVEAAKDRDLRYPRVGLAEVIAAQPELILLPSEPFAYAESHVATFTRLLAETPAVQAGRIYTLDGTLITWPGTRLARALEDLPALFSF